jgi:hypothetical protein
MNDLIHILVAAAFVGIPVGLMIWSAIRSEREVF